MNSGEILQNFSADLHLHTVLSPCGSLEMSPGNIIREAARKGLDIIGITDHNASANCRVTARIAEKFGIFVLCGMEVTTVEETHGLAFFENFDQLETFQQRIDSAIYKIKNDPDKFGYQVIVDENEQITGEIDWLLLTATTLTLDELASHVHSLNGLYIPAHIDRSMYSLTSQLGFIPQELDADAYEVSRFSSPQKICKQFPYLNGKTFIQSSDAHFLKDIGTVQTIFRIKNRSFQEIKRALQQSRGRSTTISKHYERDL
ncbi:MAG: PHP domain-containing protein [Bacteroidia bacterium]|nr:PHP domain-containing protein [Bacteroidia bacterium]